jgi:hypothetical protein
VAFPAGTTISGLLAMLGIDGRYTVAMPNGETADPYAPIGVDVPTGLVLTVVDQRSASARPAKEVREEERGNYAAQVTGSVLLVLPAELAFIVYPLAQGYDFLVTRVFALVLAVLVLGILCLRTPILRSLGPNLLVVGMLALGAAAFVSPAIPHAPAVAFVLASCVGFVLSLLVRPLLPDSPAVLWGMLALFAALGACLGWKAELLGPLALAVGTAIACFAPQFSVRVPEEQLVDMPLVAVSATSPRSPEVRAPAAITRKRVRRLLEGARGVTMQLTLGGVVILSLGALLSIGCFAGGPLVLGTTLGLFSCSLLLLVLSPLTDSVPLARLLPRMAALLVLLVGAFAGGLILGAGWMALGIGVFAVLLVVVEAALAAREESALIGRICDIGRSLSAFALFPCAVFASGLFDAVWKAMS